MKFSLGEGALAEDQELVGGGGEDAGVVADEQERGAALMAQAAEEGGEFQDAGGIQGSEGFIGDDEGRPAGQGLGDGHALAFAAGELVGIGGEDGGGRGDAGEREEVGRAALGVVRAQDFGDLLADGEDRVEGEQRILEDDGDLRAAGRLQRAFGQGEQVASAQEDLSADAVLGGRQEVEKGQSEGGLAGAGIAGETDDGGGGNVEGNAAQNGAVGEQVDGEIADFEQRLGRHWSYSMASRRVLWLGIQVDPFGATGEIGTRLTVLVRIVLAIPHLIVLYALGIATEVVALISWFAALFTGRVPIGLADFMSGYLRWATRVYAYLFLLTDEYPPFELGDSDYPVHVAVRPGRLNRLAVLFRIILAIPAWLVASLLSYGLGTIAIFITWLIVLVSGTMPETLYGAIAAVVRYLTRFYGYSLLLTGTYPKGLFGDEPGLAGSPGLSQPGYGQPGYPEAGYGQPGYPEPGYGQPGRPQPGYGHT